MSGSLSLLGARLDDLRLHDYHETVAKTSPLVRVLEPLTESQPNFVQFGWSAADGVKVPDDSTLWTSSGGQRDARPPRDPHMGTTAPALIFGIALSVDQNYMFSVRQSVHATGTASVQVWPWERVRRDTSRQPPVTACCSKACWAWSTTSSTP